MVASLSMPGRRAHVLPLALRAALALLLLVAGTGPAWAQAVKIAQVSIGKTVVAPRGMQPTTGFQAELRCTSPSGPTQVRVALVPGRATAARAPVGSDCVVAERPVPVPAGNAACPFPEWAPAQYSPSASFTIPQSGAITRIVITNQLVCRPAAGTLIVAKRTVLPPGVRATVSAVTVDVDCSPTGPKTSLAVPANGQARPVAIPAGAACTVTERVPAAPADCSWAATQVPPGAVTAAAGATVTVNLANTLTCNRPGRLVLVKRTNPSPGIPSFAPRFLVKCGPAGPNSRVAIPARGQAVVSGIPAGSLCTLTEEIPRSAVPNCAWTPSQNPPGDVPILSGATVTVTVTNDWVCRSSNLVIAKTTVAAGVALPAQIPFSVTCRPGNTPATVMVPSNGSSAPLSVPMPATCTIAEQTPSAPAGCSWTMTQSPAGIVRIVAEATITVTVTNKLTCQAQPGGLIIRRTFDTNLASINLEGRPPETSFDVKCSPAGPNTTVSVPFNGDSPALAIPGSSTCTLTERLVVVPTECSRRVTQVPSGNVTIPAGPATVVTVDEIMFCVGPSEIRIEKSTTVPPNMTSPEYFQFEINCHRYPPASSGVWTVPANGASGRILIPPDNICSVTETIPPAPAGCRWTTTQSPTGALTIRPGEVSRVVFANRLECS